MPRESLHERVRTVRTEGVVHVVDVQLRFAAKRARRVLRDGSGRGAPFTIRASDTLYRTNGKYFYQRGEIGFKNSEEKEVMFLDAEGK